MALMQCEFFSEVLELSCSMNVILPQITSAGYLGVDDRDAPPEHGWPTLWLLHGLSDDHTMWVRRTSIESYAASRGMAVVMPAVHRSFYTNTVTGMRYFDFVADELPAICRQMFRLSPRREDNFAAGLSMGGYGALKLAMTYPDRYAAAGSFSGALDVVYRLKRTDVDDGWKREMVHVFGPTEQMEGSGDDLMAVVTQLAKRAGDVPMPRLFQCCGGDDFLLKSNHRFRDHALANDLDLTYREDPGYEHRWDYWDLSVQYFFDWLDGLGSQA